MEKTLKTQLISGVTAQDVVQGIQKTLAKYGIYIAFLMLCMVMTFLSPFFLTVANFMNVLKQVSIIGVIAIGSTLVLLSGGIDLSPGSIVALSGVVAAMLGNGTYPVIVPIAAAIGVGLLCGFVNGVITAKERVPPFIVTLGVMTVARGLALLISHGAPITNLSESVRALGGSYLFGVPILIFIFGAVFLIFAFMMNATLFGRHILAIGGNEHSAHLSGLNVDRIKIAVYMIAAALSGFGGLLLSSRIASGSPISGTGYELDAIAAAVIGGTSTTGGSGKISGTIVGVLIIGVISNGLDMINVASYYQQIVKGIIIVLAVTIDMRTKRNSRN